MHLNFVNINCNFIIVYGGKPIVPDENYDGGFYILNLSKSAMLVIV